MGIFDFLKGKKEHHIDLFPEIDSVFETNIDKAREVFFPICSIRLGVINKNWGDEKIHLIQYNEDPYNEATAAYFTEYCKDNMIAFNLRNGKYEFKTSFKYFDLQDNWKEWFEKTKETFIKSKEEARQSGENVYIKGIPIGGKPEWLQDDETPLDPGGKPMHFITEFDTHWICDDYCEKRLFLFYSPEYRIAVQLYQIT